PANGYILGGGVSLTSLLGDTSSTHISSGLFNFLITSKKQIIYNLRSNIYSRDDKWILQGDWRFLLFSQKTYGLGIYDVNSYDNTFYLNSDISGNGNVPEEEPMRYNYIRFYESVNRKIAKNLYWGLGVNIDVHSHIRDNILDTSLTHTKITNHYHYSIKNGFSPFYYSTSGLIMNLIYDTRDNSINTFKGEYAQLSFRSNHTFLGSSENSTSLFYDFRKYYQLSPDKRGHILAFWLWGQFLIAGKIPYLALPSITWDTYNRSGRGYIQGRFRGENMVYLESEYRFPISKSGLIGGVLFLNTTSASCTSSKQKLFTSIAPGYGAGIRIKFDKETRTNMVVDVGIGRFHSSGIYFNLQETF
ncbi:MAG: hypothetical protein RLZZ543_2091, partial [Bacteroidota bacterium]